MVRLRAHRNESLGGLQWQYKIQDKNRLHSRNRSIFFWPEIWTIINNRSPCAQASEYESICSPSWELEFISTIAHRTFNFGARTDLFAFIGNHRLFFRLSPSMGARTDTLQWGQISCSLLYLPLSIGSLEQFWNVITLELRASFSARKSSFSFFFNGCLVSHGLYQAIISTVQQYPPTNNCTLHLHDHITSTIHDLNLQQ